MSTMAATMFVTLITARQVSNISSGSLLIKFEVDSQFKCIILHLHLNAVEN